MAPAVPLLSRKEALLKYSKQLADPEKYHCQLKSIIQHECVFNANSKIDSEVPAEIICLPFKRIFQRCLIEELTRVDGKKQKLQKWVNIEITDKNTNRDLIEDERYSQIVNDFVAVSKNFDKWFYHEV